MLNESNIPLEEDGIEEEILVEDELTITKAMWGDIGGNIANQTDLQNALDAKQDSLTEAQLNAVNSGITANKVTTYDGYADQIASKANQSALNAEATTREQADTALGRRIDDEATARQNADNGLQSQIDAITSQSDVVDVVANYAALQAYDTSSLSDNDVIKVLDDETHEDALTYYRWSTTTQTWSYIGQEAPYYSKGQMDVKLAEKQDKLTAGANILIQNGTISATDTTYTAGNGLDLNGTEFSADTTVLATKSDLDSYYTKTETDTKLAPKLEADVVAELPTTGEEGKLYLTPKAHTTQTATGNPITATVAEEAGAIESFKLDGDTFQQSYTGKNLFDTANADIREQYILNDSGVEVSDRTGGYTRNYSKVEPSTGYILSGLDTIGGKTRRVYYYDENKGFISRSAQITTGSPTLTFTTPANCYFVNIQIFYPDDLDTSSWQLEAGNSATSFEQYVGGQPSPNPDYPQPIQTVTGLQTISINGTDYTIDLGSIELCKLGTYQDYIYKSGSDWKVHKAIDYVICSGNESWSRWATTQEDTIETRTFTLPVSFFSNKVPFFPSTSGVLAEAKSNISEVRNTVWAVTVLTAVALNATEGRCLQVKLERKYLNYTDSMTSSELEALFKNWLSDNNLILYYALATATDTTITDQTLIAQLEAIRTASLENGTNTISNSTLAPNLAGDMEVGYYGFNPRNRYDKWLWLDINNEYEQIGS